MSDGDARPSTILLTSQAMWLLIGSAILDAIYAGLHGLYAAPDVFAIIFPLLLLGAGLLLLIDRQWAVLVALVWAIFDLAGGALSFWPIMASPESAIQWLVLVLTAGFKISAIWYLANNVRRVTLLSSADG